MERSREIFEDLPTSIKQNRNLDQYKQTADQTGQQTVCQPTLQDTESPTWCMKERGNTEEDISIHGSRSQGPRTMLIVHTEPTSIATRSCVRQFSDKADFSCK